MSSNPEGAAAHAVALMADVSVWTADDWRRMLDAAAAGATVDGLLRMGSSRLWAGEAKAAYDQSVVEAGGREGFPSPDFWVARAQAAAGIASAEQARIANLIAWKALQAQRHATHDVGVELLPLDDEVTREIEEGLGLS